MLIIEIALGIVLAVVVLNYWREILKFGFRGLLLICFLAVLTIVGYYMFEYFELIRPYLGVVIFSLIYISMVFLSVFLGESLAEKLAASSLNKWELSGGEVKRILFLVLAFILGICLVSMGQTSAAYLFFGSTLLLLSLVGGFVYKKELNRALEQRAARKTYVD